MGPEVEFFYFKQAKDGQRQRPDGIDEGGYFDQTPLDVASGVRRKTVLTLEAMDIGVESSHHEAAASQHELLRVLFVFEGLGRFHVVGCING